MRIWGPLGPRAIVEGRSSSSREGEGRRRKRSRRRSRGKKGKRKGGTTLAIKNVSSAGKAR